MTRIAVLGASPIVTRAMVGPAERIGGVSLVLVGRDPVRTAQFAAENGIAQWSTSREETFANGDSAAVYVALPNALHADAAIEAITAGFDVLIEKPVCLNAAELQRISAAADAANVYVREAVMIAHHPWLGHVASVVRDGTYGKPLRSRTKIYFNPPAERIARMPQSRDGGGVLYDVASYWLTITQQTLGLDVVDMAVKVLRTEGGRDLEVEARLGLRDGVEAELVAGFGRSEASYELFFESGTLRAPSFLGPAAGTAMLQVVGENAAGERAMKLFRPASYYDAQLRAFLTDRVSGARGSAGLAEVAARMQVLHGMISLLLGRI